MLRQIKHLLRNFLTCSIPPVVKKSAETFRKSNLVDRNIKRSHVATISSCLNCTLSAKYCEQKVSICLANEADVSLCVMLTLTGHSGDEQSTTKGSCSSSSSSAVVGKISTRQPLSFVPEEVIGNSSMGVEVVADFVRGWRMSHVLSTSQFSLHVFTSCMRIALNFVVMWTTSQG